MTNPTMKRPPFSLKCSSMTTYWDALMSTDTPDTHPQQREAVEDIAREFFELHAERCHLCADAATLALNGLVEGAPVVRERKTTPSFLIPREDDK